MKAIFCGVGEAFDETLSNTSILVVDDSGGKPVQVLLDCGFSAPGPFWRNAPGPLDLDAVWVSHFHGDHFFGLPQLMLRFFEEGRRRPFTIVCPAGDTEKVTSAMSLAYPGFSKKFTFSFEIVEVDSAQTLDLAGFNWSFAPVAHSRPCLAVRLTSAGGSLFYSGDGRPTDESLELARGVDLIVHEAFTLALKTGEQFQGHGSVRHCIEFAREAGARTLALVHLNRQVRRGRAAEIRELARGINDLKVLLPEPGLEVRL